MSIIPRYISISKAVEAAIELGRLKPGWVLTEDPLARHFNTSRTTIRKALSVLHDTNKITRFGGRGFLVGSDSSVEPHRDSIERALFDASSNDAVPRAVSNPDQILPILREELIRALPFGPLHINEAKLIERFSVSRSVVREMLSQLRSSGIVQKSARSKWVLPVLTASDVRNHYQLRILLEPVALSESAPQLAKSQVNVALSCLLALNRQEIEPNLMEISKLENALHVRTLAGCSNDHLLKTLQKSRLVLAINEMFRLILGRSPDGRRLVHEHLAIFQALADNHVATASELLVTHLIDARERTCKRLQTLSVLQPPDLPEYLSPVSLTIG